MADPFVGEIRMFGGNFAPRNWALCNGQLLSIAQNTALFSILGTNYGGDGKSTFGLPNLQGSTPMDQGQGPGLTQRFPGETGGSSTATLNTSEMPAHTHLVTGQDDAANKFVPDNNYVAFNRTIFPYTAQGVSGLQLQAMAPQAIGTAGGNLPHNNMQPYLVVTFIIALYGVYPSRN